MARTGRALLSLAVLTHYCTAQQPDGLSLYESRVNARADGPCDDSDKDQKCGLALQGGRLSFAWSTPLLKFDLKEVEDDIASFNKAIHDVLLQEWDSFVEGCNRHGFSRTGGGFFFFSNRFSSRITSGRRWSCSSRAADVRVGWR